MKTSDFHFELPKSLIASEPLKNRSASRLMCLDQAGAITHKHFYDLPDLLQPGDLLVFNNSKVIPARLYAFKPTGGKVEILIERILDDRVALAHVKGAKSLKEGSKLYFQSSSPTSEAQQASCGDDVLTIGKRVDDLLTLTTNQNWHDLLAQYGHMPLPPYMERQDRDEDKERYQTVYAKHEGSVAAPTAGLHFDEALLEKLNETGIQTAFVTLHVGAGTFQPVRVDDIHDHKMHSERFEISSETIDLINQTRECGGRIVAVGTTSVRVLESVSATGDTHFLKDAQTASEKSACPRHSGETDIFITPGYTFKVVDGLITNFHLPESTLLMLVSAFSGKENILNAYKEAVAENYRFFSYGDAMLLT
jgi:S-adenosylmethionine:tRNA ribosyltransferase-isomerase